MATEYHTRFILERQVRAIDIGKPCEDARGCDRVGTHDKRVEP